MAPDLSVLQQHLISPETARRTVDFLAGREVDTWVFSGQDWLLQNDAGPHVEHETFTVGFPPIVVAEFGKRVNPDIARYQRQHRQHTLQIAELAIKWDQEHPRNYDQRWINLYGKVARTSAGTDPAELSVPESEWPVILQRVHEAHLKSVQEFAAEK